MIAYPPHLADIALGKLQPLHTEAHTNLVSLEAGQRDGSSGLNGLCRWYGAVAVYNAGSANGSDGIDWPSWRTAHEYSALYTRSCAREPHPDNAPMLTRILTQAMSLVMVGHIKAAQRTLKGVSAPLLKLIARMNLAEDRPKIGTGDLGSLGLLFDRVIGEAPRHKAFVYDKTLLTQQGVAQIGEARKSYAEANSEGPAILSGHYFDIIPLEQIFVNFCAPATQQDATLNAFATAMQGTAYPEDPLLVSYDDRLMDMGL